jgi:hypothetical protein
MPENTDRPTHTKGGMTMICSLSNLQSQDLDQIKSLETETGHTILAYSCHDAKMADLKAETLTKIQALEKKLGLSLVAVKA